jgi:hypothetical protein
MNDTGKPLASVEPSLSLISFLVVMVFSSYWLRNQFSLVFNNLWGDPVNMHPSFQMVTGL